MRLATFQAGERWCAESGFSGPNSHSRTRPSVISYTDVLPSGEISSIPIAACRTRRVHRAESRQCPGYHRSASLGHRRRPPDDRRARRVRQGPDQVHHGGNTKLAPNRPDMAHGGVVRRREEEDDAYVGEHARGMVGVKVDRDTERFEDVR